MIMVELVKFERAMNSVKPRWKKRDAPNGSQWN